MAALAQPEIAPRDVQTGDAVGLLCDDAIANSAVPARYNFAADDGYTHFTGIFPGDPPHIVKRGGYGESWRFADECSFRLPCSKCKARGTVLAREPFEPTPDGRHYYASATCPVCQGSKWVEWEPFAPGAVKPDRASLVDDDGTVVVSFGGHVVRIQVQPGKEEQLAETP